MEQPNSTPYGTSTVEMPVPLPFRIETNEPNTPDFRQPPFDESSYFHTVPPEILSFRVTTVAESSLDPWFIDMPGTASPQSLRLSMSPSHDVATPSSDGYYSPPYPEQLQLPAYHFLEQPQPLRTCSTSHPDWVSNGGNWEGNYAQSEFWATQPYVAQPWVPSQCDAFVSHNIARTQVSADHGALAQYMGNLPQPQVVQIMTATSNGSPSTCTNKAKEEEQDSSDEDSDWDEDSVDFSQSDSSMYRHKPRTGSARPHVDRWSLHVNSIQQCIQQSEVRAHKCNEPGCPTAFVRPEHLRRHVRSKHTGLKTYKCRVEGCKTPNFSRGDNLRDHYWTHLDRGGRVGKNKKFTLQQLKEILGPKEKKLIRRLREKQKQHEAKERLKKQRAKR